MKMRGLFFLMVWTFAVPLLLQKVYGLAPLSKPHGAGPDSEMITTYRTQIIHELEYWRHLTSSISSMFPQESQLLEIYTKETILFFKGAQANALAFILEWMAFDTGLPWQESSPTHLLLPFLKDSEFELILHNGVNSGLTPDLGALGFKNGLNNIMYRLKDILLGRQFFHAGAVRFSPDTFFLGYEETLPNGKTTILPVTKTHLDRLSQNKKYSAPENHIDEGIRMISEILSITRKLFPHWYPHIIRHIKSLNFVRKGKDYPAFTPSNLGLSNIAMNLDAFSPELLKSFGDFAPKLESVLNLFLVFNMLKINSMNLSQYFRPHIRDGHSHWNLPAFHSEYGKDIQTPTPLPFLNQIENDLTHLEILFTLRGLEIFMSRWANVERISAITSLHAEFPGRVQPLHSDSSQTLSTSDFATYYLSKDHELSTLLNAQIQEHRSDLMALIATEAAKYSKSYQPNDTLARQILHFISLVETHTPVILEPGKALLKQYRNRLHQLLAKPPELLAEVFIRYHHSQSSA